MCDKKQNRVRKQTLEILLSRAKRLRGFGDMDTYSVAGSAASVAGIYGEASSQLAIDSVFTEFSRAVSYEGAKKKLISELEARIREEGSGPLHP